MEHDKEDLLERTYKLAKENNHMLHAMRRNAFWGFLFRLLIWALVLGVPIWFYIQFVHPVLQSTVGAFNQAQDAGAQFSAQFGEFSSFLDRFGGGSAENAE